VNPLLIGLIGFLLMLGMKALRSPVGVGLAVTGFFGVWYLKGLDTALFVVGTAPFESLTRLSLTVFPLFVMMGVFAMRAGLAEGLFNAAYACVGQFRGGLGIATILGCGGLAAVNGSSLSTAATMTKIAVPQMLRFGYDPKFAAGTVAAGGTLGIMIPPSLGMIIYAVLTEVSIGRMFAAGIVPGIVAVVIHICVIGVWTRLNPRIGPAGETQPWRMRLRALTQVWGVVVLFGGVMGGIFFGVFSPTEGAAVGAFGALAIGIAVGKIGWRECVDGVRESVQITTMVMFILVGISIFEFFITSAQFPQQMARFIEGLALPDTVVMLGIVAFLILLGGFMEVIAIIFITTPFIFPIIVGMGYDPIWWGIVMILVAEFGVITPPVGMNVFVVAKMVPETTIAGVYQGIMPFLLGDTVRLILLLAVPGLALWLPNLLFGAP
jgi:tripartite ATP-independent transporter DctM subunit